MPPLDAPPVSGPAPAPPPVRPAAGQFATDVPALLLRLDRNPFHHGSLGAARSLGRAGIEVHAFTEGPRTPLARSRHLHRAHPMPAAEGDRDAVVARALERVAERIGRPAVLIAMDDMGALTAARLAGRLRGHFLLPGPPPGTAARLADKAALAGLCRDAEIPHPETVAPGSAAHAVAAARELGLPLVAKWDRPWLLPPGGALRSTTVVTGVEQIRRLYAATPRAGGAALLLQRYLPGPGEDWFFHGCFAADGRLLTGGTGRKELSWPPAAGLTAVGRWRDAPEVARAGVRLARLLRYHGVLDLDFRRDPRTGAYHLLDANPRPGAQFRLFADGRGTDVVRALHLDLTGRAVPEPRPVPGRVFVAENYGLLSALRALPGGPLPVPAGGAGLETAWFAADDPRPLLTMAGGWLRRAAGKAVARAGRRS
ncbi:ATP-grasp domain-containing protein [Streptomyces sp. YIM 98790]|uniref:carboxylate--amine ligase n=1 Tax=Streptomyces sp. YIM 98790 TaxID=2689077 RepID=UPI001FB606F1|nr:ATP-grasp domain-containing protein [Streptomyces sp. YIM 98790]